VLEGVVGIRRRPSPEDQFGTHELGQGVIELMARHLRDSTDKLMGEPTPESCCNLRKLARWSQTIEPRKERGVQRGRNRQGAAGPVDT
jgi:hypothetical protein